MASTLLSLTLPKEWKLIFVFLLWFLILFQKWDILHFFFWLSAIRKSSLASSCSILLKYQFKPWLNIFARIDPVYQSKKVGEKAWSYYVSAYKHSLQSSSFNAFTFLRVPCVHCSHFVHHSDWCRVNTVTRLSFVCSGFGRQIFWETIHGNFIFKLRVFVRIYFVLLEMSDLRFESRLISQQRLRWLTIHYPGSKYYAMNSDKLLIFCRCVYERSRRSLMGNALAY